MERASDKHYVAMGRWSTIIGMLISIATAYIVAHANSIIDYVQALIEDEASFGLQFRLADRFGDNGVIAVVNGHVDAAGDGWIDDWVMSCRVFGRGVEGATLEVVVEQLRRRGARRLIGRHVDSGRNGITRSLLDDLGFRAAPDLSSRWQALELAAVPRQDHQLSIAEEEDVA